MTTLKDQIEGMSLDEARRTIEMDRIRHESETTVDYDGETFTIAELRTAFEKVQNPDDWKGPIEAVIPLGDRKVTEASVEFFTATKAQIELHMYIYPPCVSVRSVGYRMGPAGP